MFSIIIPCYNVEGYISSTINSVLKQKYNNWELILVNDGSTDDTTKILEKYNKKHERITLIEQDNNGVSSARNKGLKKAKGKFIFFLDGDDFIRPDLLFKANKVFDGNPDVDIFSFGFNIVNKNNQVIKSYTYDDKDSHIFSSNDFMNLYLTKKIRQSMCSFIVKKEVLSKNKIYFSKNISYGEDQEVQLKSIFHSNKIFYSAKPFFEYLQRESSAVNNNISIKRIDLIKVISSLREYFICKKIDDELLKDLNNYLSMIFIFLFREGVKQNANSFYFEELSSYSNVFKKTSINFTKYGIINYFASRLYLINPNLLSLFFKLVYR